MKKLALATAAALATLACGTAFATSGGCQIRYATRFQFDRIAFGKEVVGVYAHVGSLQRASAWRGGQRSWDDVQHIQLVPTASAGFVGYGTIAGAESYEYTYSEGAIVQYWVYFADGSQMITEPAMVRIAGSTSVQDSSNFDRKAADAIEQLSHEPAVDTSAIKIQHCWVS